MSADSAARSPASLIGSAPVFLAAVESASRLAQIDRPVLIVGERGVGKELFAQRLHFLSPRWDGPLVTVNCAALSPDLLESELFGHEAGAFTGAARAREGRFAQADGGTLFLDEIATARPSLQEALLRVIEYGVYEPLGSSRSRRTDARIVAATNVDLTARAAEGTFRADLLDRLAFDVITVPPLRARSEDIPALAEHFAIGMARDLGHGFFAGFTERALDTLQRHSWPGNVRELRNAVERSVARNAAPEEPVDIIILDPFASPYRPTEPSSQAESPPALVPASPPSPSPSPSPPVDDLRAVVDAYEKGLVEQALTEHRYHQKQAAAALGLEYHQLRHLLKKHGIGGGREES